MSLTEVSLSITQRAALVHVVNANTNTGPQTLQTFMW